MTPIEPTPEQLSGIAERVAAGDNGPCVMLNLNRYSDREAYLRYGMVALQVLERVGGRVQWHTDARFTAVGGDTDQWDEVIAVWYPSLEAFLALVADPELNEAAAHRRDGLERAAVIACAAE